MDLSKITHPLYKNINDKCGQAESWAFLDKKKFQRIHHDLPQLCSDEVLGTILYAGLCHSDSMHGRSKWYDSLYPTAPGHEIVARVEKVGADVKEFKEGDIFLVGCYREHCGNCRPCQEGYDNLCLMDPQLKFTYGLKFGGYSTHIQIKEYWCYPAPKGLDLANAAPLMCAGITTYCPLSRYGKKGMKVAILGVGGLGHVAVQYAHKMGMEVTAFVHTLAKAEDIKKLGATEVVDWVNSDLKSLENKFDMILSTLPISPTAEQNAKLFACIVPNGRFIQVGIPDRKENFSINPACFVFKSISISGSLIGSKKETKEMLKFSAEHGVHILCEHFSFDNFPEALNKLENGKPHFRCVVDVQPASSKYSSHKSA